MWIKVYFAYLFILLLWLGIRYRKDWREGILRWIVAATLPAIGLLLPLFFLQGSRNRNETLEFDFISVDSSQQPEVYDTEAIKKEMNTVPLEEALLINDQTTRRGVMIDLLKQDSLDFLDVLQLAVANDDTETSHYAVSAIMEVKRKLLLAIQELSVRYETDKHDAHLLRSYADVLKSYLASGFLDERTILNYRHTYIEVLGNLIRLMPDEPANYMEKIEAEIAQNSLGDAEETAQLFLDRLPGQEDAYLFLLKVYYTRRSYDQLRLTLKQLRESPIRLSNRALSIVRYWMEVGALGNQAKD